MSSLSTIASLSLALGIICFVIIVLDIRSGHLQRMAVMNAVYPITALYAGPLALLVYFTIGRKSVRKPMAPPARGAGHDPNEEKPFWQSVAVGTLHCGAGCTTGDILAEILLLIFPVTLFGMKLYGGWVIEYVFALGTGVLFQYYAIKPMKKMSSAASLRAAFKADVLSLTFWQIGMYGWMAIATLAIFHHELSARTRLFWFMMQIGMLLGFLTAYPINWLLLRKKIKEAM